MQWSRAVRLLGAVKAEAMTVGLPTSSAFGNSMFLTTHISCFVLSYSSLWGVPQKNALFRGQNSQRRRRGRRLVPWVPCAASAQPSEIRMRCRADSKSCSRRRTVASLLVFARELEKAGRISKASKGLLKELIVHQNAQVMSIGDGLARADGAGEQASLALEQLEELIKHRASKSHQELFEICSLEEAHLLSQHDTESLAEGVDTKSLVYGEIDFWSFYDVIKVAADGIDATPRRKHKTMANSRIAPPAEPSAGSELYQTRQPLKQERRQHQKQQQQQQDEDEEEEEEEEYQERQRRRRRHSGEHSDDDEAGSRTRQAEKEEPRRDGGGDNIAGDGRKPAAIGEKVAVGRTSEGGVGIEVEATAIESGGGGGDDDDGCGGGGGGGSEGEAGGLKFYDLGSGSGRAVFAAVLAVDFRCAVGIEFLAGIHHASTRVLKRYRKLVEPALCSPAVINLYHGSFLEPECDWSDGDLVFANSTCFAEDTLAAIADRATLLRPGARVVTFTTALKTPWLRVLLKRRYQMSWGPATVFVHQKLSREEYAARLTETTPFDEDQGMPRPGNNLYTPGNPGMEPGCPRTTAGSSAGVALPAPAPTAPPASPASPPSLPSNVNNGGGDIEAFSRLGDGSGGSSSSNSSSSNSSGFGLGGEMVSGGDSATGEEEEEEEEEEGRREEEEGVGRAAAYGSSPRRPLHC